MHTTEQTKHTYLIGQIDHNQIGYNMETNCLFCNSKMKWMNDEDMEQVGYTVKGIVSYLKCSNCHATAEFYLTDEGEIDD